MAQGKTKGLLLAIAAALAFGASGVFVKPLLDAGWSPAAAVTTRALIAGLVLLPLALSALKSRWDVLWQARWRIMGMGLFGVAGTQLAYYAAIQRIPVGTAVLLEYMAPILLVLTAWATTRKSPHRIVLLGSVLAIVGLYLVVAPNGIGSVDSLGFSFGLIAMVGCATYYVISARDTHGLPTVVLASSGLLLGGLVLGLVSLTGVLPFTATFTEVDLFGTRAPWWIPLGVVALIATAFAYASSIAAAEILGSRLASFLGLLEVIAATVYAWVLLGETLSVIGFIGGALILAGIVCVRSEASQGAKTQHVPEPLRVDSFARE